MMPLLRGGGLSCCRETGSEFQLMSCYILKYLEVYDRDCLSSGSSEI